MKYLYIIILSIFSLNCYSQISFNNSTSREASTPGGTTETKITITGETNCCHDNYDPNANIYSYDVDINGGLGWNWTVTITDGLIIAVDGVSESPTNTWTADNNNEETFDNYTFTINWDDEAGNGNINIKITYQYFWWWTKEKEADFLTHIGQPTPATNITFSDNTPYSGQLITCLASGSEGTDISHWHTNNGTITNEGNPVNYTSSSPGNANISTYGVNACGNSTTYSESLTISNPGLNTNIVGPDFGNNSDTFTWTGSASGGTPPYQYDWYKKYTASANYQLWFTNLNPLVVQMPQDLDLYLKLVVTDANGWTGTSTHYTRNGGGHHKSVTLDDNTQNNEFTNIYPNPAKNKVDIPGEYIKNYTSLIIYSVDGKLLANYLSISNEIDLSSFEKGLLIFKFINNSNGNTKNVKVIKE